MNRARAYLDFNATAPMRPEAAAAMQAAFAVYGNPSSVHAEGRAARALIETARDQLAGLVGCAPDGVTFTASGTEANNAVLAGPWSALAVSAVEHDSVLEAAKARVTRDGLRLVIAPVEKTGRLDLAALDAALAELTAGAGDGRPVLLSVQLANGETGVVQPIGRIAEMAGDHGVLLHVDAVQAAGRMEIGFADLGAHYLTLSAHKLGGPKGVGALIAAPAAPRTVLLHGGGQESRLRAGTENVPGIAGFGAAAEAARRDLGDVAALAAMRDALEAEVRKREPRAVIVGADRERLINTSCIALPESPASTTVIAFDLAGVAVSAGSACSSGKVGASHVLKAMKAPKEIADSAIRVSFGWASSPEDVDRFLTAWERLRAARQFDRAVA